MFSIYKDFTEASESGKKLLSVLLDPDKFEEKSAETFLLKLPVNVTHIFVGGSRVEPNKTDTTVQAIKSKTNLPVILFPGDHSQISEAADGILFLSLISGRNPEYLIGQQLKSVSQLRNSKLEIIPTGYILIDGGNKCSVHQVSNTKPIPQIEVEIIVKTALAGQFSGKKLIYLEAGSGAEVSVSAEIISAVKEAISIPLIVGGGIRTTQQLKKTYAAGADIVVIGNAFENDEFF